MIETSTSNRAAVAAYVKPGSNAGKLLTLELILAVIVLACYLLHKVSYPLALNLNCAVYLKAAQLMLNGWQPFIDFWDTNPPLIFFVNLPPAVLSAVLHLRIDVAFDICVFVVALLSVGACYLFLRGDRGGAQFIGGLLGLSCLTAATGYDFGEREHLFILLSAPFFVVRCLRWNGGARGIILSSLAGFAAALACCIKPFFLLCLVGPECFWSVRFKTLRPIFAPEAFGFAAGICAVGLSFFQLPAQARTNLWGLLPLMSKGYAAFNCSLFTAATCENCRVLAALAVVTVTLSLILRRYSYFLVPLAIYVFCAYIGYVVQQKGWTYHALPICAGTLMLAGIETRLIVLLAGRGASFTEHQDQSISTLIRDGDARFSALLNRALTAAIICGLFCAAYFGLKMERSWRERPAYVPVSEMEKLVAAKSAPGDFIAILTTCGSAWPCLTQLNRTPATRFSSLFLFPLLERIRSSTQDQSKIDLLESQVAENIVSDLVQFRPKLIFIQIHNEFCPPDFSLVEMLNQHNLGIRCLGKYRSLAQVADYRVYERN